jgi:predicted permease
MSIVAFGLSSLLACGLGLALSTRLFGRRIADGAMAGMASGYVNSANLGIPVAVQVLGNAGFLSTVILFNTVLMTPIVLALMDLGSGGAAGAGQRLRGVVLLPVRNPIIIASAVGALVSGTHWHVPGDLSHALSLLGGAAVPIALVTLGMSLHAGGRESPDTDTNTDTDTEQSGPARSKKSLAAETAASVVLKTAVQPALAYLLARYALHLHAHDVLAVTLCAALPTAQNVFIYAGEYRLDTAFARNAVVFSTLVSMAGLWTVVTLLK